MVSNQRLLISVFDAQEAREACAGGARVIDCEDPSGALGDISPRKVMLIADGTMGYKRDLDVQISTNIGENQMLFKRDESGRAVQRFEGEIAGKAAQAALGVAAAMGTDLHPVNIVKVGLDNMPVDIAREVLKEVVLTLDRSSLFSRTQVIAVFFAQRLDLWRARKTNDSVVRDLILAREFSIGGPHDIDLDKLCAASEPFAQALADKFARDPLLFSKDGVRRPRTRIKISELTERDPLGFSDEPLQYLKQVADLTAECGADGIMIDTRIHSKIAKVCCHKHQLHQAPPPADPNLKLEGIFEVAEITEYTKYCHSVGLEFWASGSVQPYQAQDLWAVGVDGMAVRSGASSVLRASSFAAPGKTANDTRGAKKVYRDLVALYQPQPKS
jgi:uncharacterized protein (UPF0264 family)